MDLIQMRRSREVASVSGLDVRREESTDALLSYLRSPEGDSLLGTAALREEIVMSQNPARLEPHVRSLPTSGTISTRSTLLLFHNILHWQRVLFSDNP